MLDYLYRSTNGGYNFSLVDTNKVDYEADLLFDSDIVHIYRVVKNYNGGKLIASNNSGDQFSWEVRWSSGNPIFLSIDHSQAGNIFLAELKKIYESKNYGETFNFISHLKKRLSAFIKSQISTSCMLQRNIRFHYCPVIS